MLQLSEQICIFTRVVNVSAISSFEQSLVHCHSSSTTHTAITDKLTQLLMLNCLCFRKHVIYQLQNIDMQIYEAFPVV